MIHQVIVLLLLSATLSAAFQADSPIDAPAHSSAVSQQWYSMRNAQLKAAVNQKKVMVDIYADWCVWCKKMDSEVYTDARVKQHLRTYFYPVKINGESDKKIVFNGQELTAREFAQQLGISAFPTILFIDAKGEIIAQQGGFMKPNIFNKLLVYVGTDAYKKVEFDQFTLSEHSPEE